ncbi:hypothetical protein [Leptospira kmetyi]|uniref:hypothetical protein n=1 Tax=Leptospira kmetyi TaxID=408139 RepID=UPI003EBA8727
MNKTIIISKITRTTIEDHEESVIFKRGFNAIVGEPNSGKTTWLKMLDFVFGDIGKAEDAFGEEDSEGRLLSEKYKSCKVFLTIAKENFTIERNWQESGKKTKIKFNDQEEFDSKEFTDFIYGKLNIPKLHFPKGNPYADATWPTLSWRVIFRHLYRQERFWGDLADNQPKAEQHSALALFLGIAENIFPQDLSEYIELRKTLIHLEAQRTQYEDIINKLFYTMSTFENKDYLKSGNSVADLIGSIEEKIKENLKKKDQIIRKNVNGKSKVSSSDDLKFLSKKEETVNLIENLHVEMNSLRKRINEFKALEDALSGEINRLKRAIKSGELLSNIKVTHCPVCDQSANYAEEKRVNHCFLCHKPIKKNESSIFRVEFELNQNEAELKEVNEIKSTLTADLNEITERELRAKEELATIERKFNSTKIASSVFISAEISDLDSDRGKLEEQINMYYKISELIEYKSEIDNKVSALQLEIQKKKENLDNISDNIDYEEKCTLIENKMNYYLQQINLKNKNWTLQKVAFKISGSDFSFRIKKTDWKSIGATLKVYFLFAYHYALLSITNEKSTHYPGLLIVDFPPVLAQGVDLKGTENYLIEPFIKLCEIKKNENLQMIISGRTFGKMKNVNSISMTKIWK